MTKLMEWLFMAFLILGTWAAFITETLSLHKNIDQFFKWMPLVFVSLFGLYAVITVLYRVFTFNNCEAAAAELQEQIKEATADLKARGINIKTK